MSFRTQIPFPIATPTLHTAPIAVHWHNPAHQSVENTAPHTFHGAVASGAYAFARGMTRDVRTNTAVCGGRGHDLFSSSRWDGIDLLHTTVSLSIENGSCPAASVAATRPPSFSQSSNAAFCRLCSMLRRHSAICTAKTEAATALPVGTRGGVKCPELVMSNPYCCIRFRNERRDVPV